MKRSAQFSVETRTVEPSPAMPATVLRSPPHAPTRRRAEPVRPPPDALQTFLEKVQQSPQQFDFFALLRHLDALQPQRPRYGSARRPTQEPLRLGQDTDFNFPPGALSSFSHSSKGVPRLGTRFMGLLGSHGPMPLYVTEHVRDRLRNGNDAAPARFLDLFHHRMLALFYRAWGESQPAVQHDRPSQDRFAAWLGATSGVAVQRPEPGGIEGSDPRLQQSAQLFHAGFLGTRSRHPEGLCKIIAAQLEAPVRLCQHVAQRIVISDADRLPLRSTRSSLGISGPRANGLGLNATAGRYVWDRQFKFRLEIGPLTFARFNAMLPGGAGWQNLSDWVDRYVGRDLVWEAELRLAQADVPAPRLGRRVRLGMTAWIGRKDTAERPFVLRLRPGKTFRFPSDETAA